jgi:hypothetical protein
VNDEYILVERPPTVEEYRRLREAVGWEHVDVQATEAGLRNALFSVCVIHKDEVIGCGRVVGDGGIYSYTFRISLYCQNFREKDLADALWTQ